MICPNGFEGFFDSMQTIIKKLLFKIWLLQQYKEASY